MSYFRLLRRTCLAALVTLAGCADASEADQGDDQDLSLQTLRSAAKLPTLDDVCPASRTDALCAALHAGDKKSGADARVEYDKARAIVTQRIAQEDTETVLADAAMRYYVRER